jgi:hypothetical protein
MMHKYPAYGFRNVGPNMTTVCQLPGDKIRRLDTSLSNEDMPNGFFV